MNPGAWLALSPGGEAALVESEVGGKAYGLARLSAIGLSVPEAVVLTEPSGDLRQLYDSLPTSLTEHTLAVRSSAAGEDGEQTSFAGQYETVLGVLGAETFERAVRTCMASADNVRSEAYRQDRTVAADVRMNIVVQAMIEPTMAGVVFTADPTTGRRDRLVIDAVRGRGDQLVSGEVDPEHLLLSPDGQVVFCDAPEEQRLVGEDVLRQLFTGAQRAAERLGGPQDMEWAVDSQGKVWWLQSRPITTLPLPLDEHDTRGETSGRVYTRCNIGEMMPGAVTPLTQSVTLRGIEYGLQAMQVAVGVRRAVSPDAEFTATFSGHCFLDLSAFAPMVCGVAGSNGERLCRAICGRPVEEYDPGPAWSGWTRLLNGFRYGAYLMGASRHRERMRADLATLDMPAGMDAEDLFAWIESRLPVLFEGYEHHMASSAVSGALTPALLETISGGTPPTVAHEALCATLLSDSVVDKAESHDIASGAEQLAAIIRHDAEAKSRLLNAEAATVVAYFESDEGPVGKAWQAYLSRHGHRAVRELELRQPEWRHDPSPLLETLRLAVGAPLPSPPSPTSTLVRAEPRPSWPVRALARRAARAASDREDTKSLLVAMTQRFKVAYRRLAALLVERDLLSDPDRVFFLFHEELGELLDGARGLNTVAEARRNRLAYQARCRFPDVFVGAGVPLDPLVRSAHGSDTLTGKPASPGQARGPARIVREVSDLKRVEAGDIVITPVIDVGWTPCFSIIAGLATEVGSAVSHGCVVAREYGLPAVVGLRGATERFLDGQVVVLDADEGTLRAAEPAHEA